MNEQFQQPLFCYHQKREYEVRKRSVGVICSECRLAGPHVLINRSLYLAKLRAQRAFFEEANRVDDSSEKLQNHETK